MARKQTIAGLQREVATLERKVVNRDNTIESMKDVDLSTRTRLSKLLNSMKCTKTKDFGMDSHYFTEETDVLDWIGIAFLIGELKADANYAMVIESRDTFRNESKHRAGVIRRLHARLLKEGVIYEPEEEDHD